MILQRLKIDIDTPLVVAEKYFAIISIINDLGLARREIQLMAFTAVKGDVGVRKEEFVEMYGSSLATLGNIVSKLTKEQFLKKDKKVVSVNASLLQQFEEGVRLDITLEVHVTK